MPAPDYAVEIASLEAALSTGELTVEQNGERVTYRSITDLRAGLTYFQDRAAAAAASVAGQGRFGFSPVGFCRD